MKTEETFFFYGGSRMSNGQINIFLGLKRISIKEDILKNEHFSKINSKIIINKI